MAPGTYMLVVINPDETTAFLTDAFEVLEATTDPGEDSEENDESSEPEDLEEEIPENSDEPESASEITDGANQAGSPEAGGCSGATPTSLWFLLAGLGLPPDSAKSRLSFNPEASSYVSYPSTSRRTFRPPR